MKCRCSCGCEFDPDENPMEHKLLIGDSTKVADVERVMGGEKADYYADPPYGVSVVKNGKVGADFGVAKKGQYADVVGDDTTETAEASYNVAVELKFDRFVIWGGNYFLSFLPPSDGWLIWDKRAGTEIRNTFADAEMAWCSFHTPVRIYRQLWNGMIREGEKDKRVHPTQKPVKTIAAIMSDHLGDVFDPFLGSGTTMAAADQLGRKCYGIEISPKYCAVILERMTALGCKPRLESE